MLDDAQLQGQVRELDGHVVGLAGRVQKRAEDELGRHLLKGRDELEHALHHDEVEEEARLGRQDGTFGHALQQAGRDHEHHHGEQLLHAVVRRLDPLRDVVARGAGA